MSAQTRVLQPVPAGPVRALATGLGILFIVLANPSAHGQSQPQDRSPAPAVRARSDRGAGLYIASAGLALIAGATAVGVWSRRRGNLARHNQALRANEARLQELIEDIDAIVWEAQLDGAFTYVNRYAERILGYPRKRWLESPDFWQSVLLHPDDREAANYCREHLARGEDHEFDYRAVAADGRIVWIHDVVHVVRDRHGAAVKLRGLMLDISKRKEAEQAVDASNSRLAAIMRASPVGIFRLDADGHVTFANEQAALITGLPRAPVTIDDWMRGIHPNEHDDVVRIWAEAQREGRAVEGEFRYRRPDKQNVWVLAQCQPEYDDAGRHVGFVGTITDITEQKTTERDLRDSRTQLSALMKTSPVGIFRATADGTIVFGNERAGEITGLSGDRIAESRWMDAIHPDDRKRVHDAWREGLQTKQPIRLEYRFVHPDGRVVWVYGLDEPELDATGAIQSYVGTLTDITEAKQAEQQLRLTQFSVDTSAEPTFWIRENGQIFYVNKAACASLEYTADELTSMRVSDISAALTQGKWSERYEMLRRHGTYRFESQHRTKSGSVFPVEIHSNLIVFDNEEFLCAFARDISGRREHERRIRDRAAYEHLVAELSADLLKASVDEFGGLLDAHFGQLAAVLNLDHVGFFITTADGPHAFVHTWDTDPGVEPYETPAEIADAWPWTVGEFMAFRPVIVETLDDFPPDAGQDRVTAELRGVASFVCLPLSFAASHVGAVTAATGEGARRWDEEVLAELRVIGEVVTNALLRCWSEQALRASEARFDRAMRGSSDGYWDWPDVHDEYVWWSPQFYRLLGYRDQQFEPTYSTFLDLVHPDDRERVVFTIDRNLSPHSAYDLEYRIRAEDGTYRWFRARGGATRDERGHVVSMSGSVQDITEKKHTEKALRESEEKFRRVAENALVAVAIVDEGRFVFANDAAVRLTGRSREELLALPARGHIEHVLHPEDRARYRQRQNRLNAGEFELFGATDARIMRPDGTVRWASVRTSPLVPNQRYPVILMALDVTEQKEAEQALRESEEKFRSVAQNALVGIALVEESGYTYVNDAFLAICGYTREEMQSLERGRDIDLLFPPEERERMLALRTELDQSSSARVSVPDVKVRHKDGSTRWVSVMLNRLVPDQAFPLVAMALDITDRKRAEDALRQREDLLRRTEQAARVGGWEIDYATGTIYPTDEVRRILEIPQDFTITMENSADFYTGEDFARLREAITRAVEDEAPWDLEFEIVTAKGRRVWIRNTGYAVKEDGKLVRLQGAYQDISERKRAEFERRELEAQVQQAQKLESLGVLAGGIAHDFNNLLVSILGHADLALDDLLPESPAFDSVKQIELAARRAADLAQQMLAYSGKGRFLVRPLNLSDMVREIAHLLRVSISKKATIHVELDDRVPLVQADPAQMQQIIMNLITNASDAIGDAPGVITLRTGSKACTDADVRSPYPYAPPHAGQYAFVEVTDTGCGMDAETLERIFDPFFTTKFAGRGLGLAAVLGIVRGHEGALEVRSRPGCGTTFRVLFPVAEKPSDEPNPASTNGASKRRTGTVLVIDDEPSVRALTQRALERFGNIVLTAADGEAGVETYREHADVVDAVLLDMTMPVMNGEEVLAALHSLDPALPVVLMSGYSEQEARARFAENGIAGFLQKPFQIRTLREKVESVLGQRQRSF